jgi:hypothetical protein
LPSPYGSILPSVALLASASIAIVKLAAESLLPSLCLERKQAGSPLALQLHGFRASNAVVYSGRLTGKPEIDRITSV